MTLYIVKSWFNALLQFSLTTITSRGSTRLMVPGNKALPVISDACGMKGENDIQLLSGHILQRPMFSSGHGIRSLLNGVEYRLAFWRLFA